MSTTTNNTRVWGRWDPVRDEGAPERWTKLEWWPTAADAEQALRDRMAPTHPVIPAHRARYADGTERTDAQFWGNHNSAIFLYRVAGEPGHDPVPEEAPYATIEYGPRGGIRTRPMAGPADLSERHPKAPVLADI